MLSTTCCHTSLLTACQLVRLCLFVNLCDVLTLLGRNSPVYSFNVGDMESLNLITIHNSKILNQQLCSDPIHHPVILILKLLTPSEMTESTDFASYIKSMKITVDTVVVRELSVGYSTCSKKFDRCCS